MSVWLDSSATAGLALVLALVLVASGLAKIANPSATRRAVFDLRLPAWSANPGPVRLVGPAELLLAAGLLLLPLPWFWGGALAVVVLLLGYTLIVGRALTFSDPEEPVSCACFGSLGESTLSTWTVVRNLLLLAASLWLCAAASAGNSPRSILGDFTGFDLAWLAVLALAAALGALIIPREAQSTWGAQQSEKVERTEPHRTEESNEGRGPAEPVRVYSLAGEPVTLPPPGTGARVVAYLTPGCGGCRAVTEQLERMTHETADPAVITLWSRPGNQPSPFGLTYVDSDGSFRRRYGVKTTPSVYLLGADAEVIRGPARGEDAVRLLRELV